jgi:hypothetical protein
MDLSTGEEWSEDSAKGAKFKRKQDSSTKKSKISRIPLDKGEKTRYNDKNDRGARDNSTLRVKFSQDVAKGKGERAEGGRGVRLSW